LLRNNQGRFIVGWEGKPFPGSVNIYLKGDIYTKDYRPSPDLNLGAKAIGQFWSYIR